MICYKDITFCASPNCKNKCGVQLNSEVRRKAEEWWISFSKGMVGGEPPIASSYFCDNYGEVIK